MSGSVLLSHCVPLSLHAMSSSGIPVAYKGLIPSGLSTPNSDLSLAFTLFLEPWQAPGHLPQGICTCRLSARDPPPSDILKTYSHHIFWALFKGPSQEAFLHRPI